MRHNTTTQPDTSTADQMDLTERMVAASVQVGGAGAGGAA